MEQNSLVPDPMVPAPWSPIVMTLAGSRKQRVRRDKREEESAKPVITRRSFVRGNCHPVGRPGQFPWSRQGRIFSAVSCERGWRRNERNPGERARRRASAGWARARERKSGMWGGDGPLPVVPCTPRTPSHSDCDHGRLCLSVKPQTDRLSHHSIKRSPCSLGVALLPI